MIHPSGLRVRKREKSAVPKEATPLLVWVTQNRDSNGTVAKKGAEKDTGRPET